VEGIGIGIGIGTENYFLNNVLTPITQEKKNKKRQ
jgi:hypothetical protein